MNPKTELKIDDRQAQQFLADLEWLLPGGVPGWIPADGKAGKALLQIYARYLEVLAERLNQAPDKNRLAFLDQLGMNLIPAQAARVPLVFQPLPTIRDGRVPAGTRAGAKVKDLPDPIPFETEKDIALMQARLAEVVSIWPGRDAYANHTVQMLGRQAFTLFDPLQPVPHALYLMHNIHFALSGKSTVEIDLGLSSPSANPLAVAWEYWDGTVWREFKPFSGRDVSGESFDGTAGLTRSGKIRLTADCAETKPTKVNGLEGYWIRGRMTDPLPPGPGTTVPQVDRVQIQTVIDHSLPAKCGAGLLPDAAFADAQKLDLTKTFQPLGANAQPGNVFYVACEEAFTKPEAQVTVCFKRSKTASEEADNKGKGFEVDVAKAKQLVKDAADAAASSKILLTQIISQGWLNPPAAPFNQDPAVWYAAQKLTIQNALNKLMDVMKVSILDDLVTLALNPGAWNTTGLISETTAVRNLSTAISELSPDAAANLGDVNNKLIGLQNGLVFLNLAVPATVNQVKSAAAALKISTDNFYAAVGTPVTFLSGPIPNFFSMADPNAWLNEVNHHIASALNAVNGALGKLNDTIAHLTDLQNMGPAASAGVSLPTLTLPTLAWEYWDGTHWKELFTPKPSDPLVFPGPNDGYNFLSDDLTDVSVPFKAPPDWEMYEVNSQKNHWLRVRVMSGYFSRVRLVTWTDKADNVNFVPIMEPRPPSLDYFFIGYLYRSPKDAPQACLAYNDFQWENHTQSTNWRSNPFEPFKPVQDFTPTLYFGFDKPLPADLVSLYMDIVEVAGRVKGAPVKWEYWDGNDWLGVSVQDETQAFALPGMISVTWPGVEIQPVFPVVQNAGKTIQLTEARQAAAFQAGQVLFIVKGEKGELVNLADVSGSVLTARIPPEQSYAGGQIGLAGLPRFGTPRTWLRCRLEFDGQPFKAQVNSVDVNAVWAAQVQTIRDELVGSSTAQPRQVHFTRQSPVLEGQEFEVRELEGARADVELPILRRELAAHGLTDDDLRLERDKATGKVKAVWVRWQAQPHLLFSGAEDRHYVVERSQGKLIFGDGAHGKIPPAGANNLRARVYRTGGGVAGNVQAGTIYQLLSGVMAQAVTNPRAAEGGADSELLDSVRARGPQVIRHFWQAVSTTDYEWLARQASPAVAAARVLPNTHPDGRAVKGWVKVIVIPQSQEARPEPTLELRRQVMDYIRVRMPATAANHLYVAGPDYLPVGVEAAAAARDPQQGGLVMEVVKQALARFFHPLTGGPDGNGWPFGRNVYLSDVAAVLEGLPGIDYIQTLALVLEGTPQGEFVPVPPNRIVCAGLMRLSLTGKER